MARDLDLRGELHLEGGKEVVSQLEDITEAGEKFDGETYTAKAKAETDTAERDIDGLMQKVDKLGGGEAASILLDSNAVAVTKDIGDLLVTLDRLDANDPKVDVTVANIQQLQGDLDRIVAKQKEISDTPIRADTSGATRGLNEISDSARGANSALANVVGNAAQDFGALGGVAGTAGVALGQFAEYAADAKLSGEGLSNVLSSMGKVAVPLAAIGAVFKTITGVMGSASAESERAAASVESWVSAMEAGGSAAANMTQAQRESGEVILDNARNFDTATKILTNIPVIGWFGDKDTEDITSLFSALNAGMNRYNSAVTEGGTAEAQFRAAVDASNLSGDEKKKILTALGDSQEDYAKAQENLASNEKIFAATTDSLNAALEAQADPLTKNTELWNQLKDDMRDGEINSEATAGAVNKLAHELGKTPEEIVAIAQAGLDEELEQAADAAAEAAENLKEMNAAVREGHLAMMDAAFEGEAFSSAMAKMNALAPGTLDFSLMAFKTQDAFDAVKDSLEAAQKEGVKWSQVDLTPDTAEELKNIPDHLQAITEGMAGMRESIQTEMQAAFDAGGIEGFIGKAKAMADEIGPEFHKAFMDAGASAKEADEKVHELLDGLGLLPEQVAVQIQLTHEEEARNALEAFSGFIDTLSEPKQIAINTAIAEGDIEAAYNMLNTELINRGYEPITLPVDADMAEANAKLHFWETSADGTTGTAIFDADDAPAWGKTHGWKEGADGTTGTGTLDANDGVAWDKLFGWNAGAEGTTAEATLDADKAPADAKVDQVEDKANSTKPIIDINANIQQAIVTMLIINAIAKAMAPVITIGGNTFPAIGAAAAATQLINSMHARVAVDAYLRNIPSASEIANRIGVVRVPIDAYVRTMPRINGTP